MIGAVKWLVHRGLLPWILINWNEVNCVEGRYMGSNAVENDCHCQKEDFEIVYFIQTATERESSLLESAAEERTPKRHAIAIELPTFAGPFLHSFSLSR